MNRLTYTIGLSWKFLNEVRLRPARSVGKPWRAHIMLRQGIILTLDIYESELMDLRGQQNKFQFKGAIIRVDRKDLERAIPITGFFSEIEQRFQGRIRIEKILA